MSDILESNSSSASSLATISAAKPALSVEMLVLIPSTSALVAAISASKLEVNVLTASFNATSIEVSAASDSVLRVPTCPSKVV